MRTALERYAAPAVLVAGLAISALLVWRQETRNHEDLQQATLQAAQRVADRSVAQLERALGLRGARGFIMGVGADNLDAARFRAYYDETRKLRQDLPGVLGIGFVRRVAPEAQAAYLTQARRQGGADFTIRTLQPHEGERRVIQFIEPVQTNRAALGLDVASEADRWQATERALRTGLPTLTAPVRLLQSRPGSSQGLLMVLPLPAGEGAPGFGVPAGPPGFLVSPLQLDDLLAAADLQPALLSLSLRDVSPGEPAQDFELVDAGAAPVASVGAVSLEREIMGRRWQFSVRPRPAFAATLKPTSPAAVGAASLFVSLLLAVLARLGGTLRRQTRQALAERVHLRTMIEHAGEAVIGRDLSGRVTLWNGAAARLFGYDEAQALGRALTELTLDAEHVDEDEQLRAVAAAGHATAAFDTQRRRSDGTWVDVEVSANPMFDDRGRVVGVAMVSRPITERLAQLRNLRTDVLSSQQALAAVQRDQQALLDAMNEFALVSVADVRGDIVSANDRFCAVSGYARDELLGHNHRIVNSGHHDAAFWHQMWRTIASGAAWRGEIRNRAKDGSFYWVSTIVVPFRDAAGRNERYVSLRFDITPLKTLEQSLERERGRLENILRGTDVGIWDWDIATGAVRFDARWAGIVGYSLDELRLTIDTRTGLGHPEELASSQALLLEHFAGTTDLYSLECRLRHRQGHWVWVLERGRVAQRGANGRALRMMGTLLDISDRKQAELALRESEAILRRTSQMARIGGFTVDLASGALHWSRETFRIHGLAPEHQPTMAEFTALCAPESRAELALMVDRAVRERRPWDVELRFTRPDGESVWVRSIGEAEFEGERAVRIVGSTQDISAQVLARQTLQRQQDLTQQMLETAPLSVRITTLGDNRTRLVNARFCRFVKRSREDALGLDISTYYADAAVFASIHRRVADGQSVIEEPVELIRPDHPELPPVWAMSSYLPIEHEGQPAMLAWLYDVTELRRRREEAEQARGILDAALDAVGAAFVVYDAQDRLLLCNEKYRSVSPLSASSVVPGASFEAVLRAQALSGEYPAVAARGEAWIDERLAAHRAGQAASFEQELFDGRVLRIIERRLPDGHTVGFRLDITELVRARQAAEAASQAKSAFLASTSHEIRTPLNAILGLTYLLERAELTGEARLQVRRIAQAGRSLLELINDVLDLSKIEAGQLVLDEHVFALRRLVEEKVGLLSAGLGSEGVALVLDWAPGLPEFVRGDATRLRQVLDNLLGNALKFTERGEVRLSVRRGEAPPWWVFEVADTGIGIAAEVQPRLFQAFVQADASTTRRYGGTGLGLSITGQLVQLMGGHIALESTPGRGSRFTVALPLPAATLADYEYEHDSDAEDAPTLHGLLATPDEVRSKDKVWLNGLRILVVDDSELNLEVARKVLELEGAQVSTCDSGARALEAVRQQAPFDAVLLDVQMPDMDGIDVARRLRQMPEAKTLPVIALTAGVLREERERALAAGMSDFLPKPLEPRRLVACLRRHVQHYRGRPLAVLPRAAQAAASLDRLGIAGIDDDAIAASLRQDRPLVLSMIRRLLAEFTSVASRDAASLPAALHKLKGSSQVVGAMAVARAAAQAEDALGHASANARAAALQHLQECLGVLAAAAAPHLDRESQRLADLEARQAVEHQDAVPASAAELATLRSLIEQQSARAGAHVDALAGAIAAVLGAEGLSRLRGALQDFDFEAALSALDNPPAHAERDAGSA